LTEELDIMDSKKDFLEVKHPLEFQTSLIRVPGIEAAISELRLSYPSLTDEAIARILGFPLDETSSTPSNSSPEILTPRKDSGNDK
jgi:hypothetical protein